MACFDRCLARQSKPNSKSPGSGRLRCGAGASSATVRSAVQEDLLNMIEKSARSSQLSLPGAASPSRRTEPYCESASP
jgi:hypothetical protein